MLTIEIEGYVRDVLPLKEGVSQRTNQPWRVQEYVIDVAGGGRPSMIPIAVRDGEHGRIAELAMERGEHVRVTVDVEGREYNGRWYIDTPQAWKVEKL